MLFLAMSVPYRVGPLITQRLPAVHLPGPLPPLCGDYVKPLIGPLFIAINIGRLRKGERVTIRCFGRTGMHSQFDIERRQGTRLDAAQ
jgi:hypothetical protein